MGGNWPARIATRALGDRSSSTITSRRGAPVTTECGSFEGNAVQWRVAKRPNKRWAAPEVASSSTSTSGRRQNTAAKDTANEAYPPTDTTADGRHRPTRASATTSAASRPALAPTFATAAPRDHER